MINQKITFEEYVEALEQDSVMPKQKLEKIIKAREEKNAQMLSMQMEAEQRQAELERKVIADEQASAENEFTNMQEQANQGYNNLVNMVEGDQDYEM